ncbi:gluconate:H+ symporter [Promicromonospora thailandica]|uniref:Gluconate:H+ symporter, GntP family n=1 Tax=Promicromonospora thailandica TaxID=765201 RepID=A0A9X2JY90_9MICO|nr:gluconate:H+ symporter [Promicromonospora thailandica]MCP2266973.1 gluconate:H+ symporter, GntP family [Promicromonospora thailandica]BFF16753.1 gluconate:H+ symporter [Promicromonospora thailandica]
MPLSPTLVPAAADAAAPAASTPQLVVAAVAGIAVIVALIVWLKMHPFLALVLGSGVLALAAGIGLGDTFTSFTAGLGSTVAGVGVLIALGAIIGKLLIDSGGADRIVDTILDRTPAQRLPWAMALIAFVVGIPLFFEVGVVLLIPVVMIVARRLRSNPVLVGIPALAGLSALHGLVPPHPGPLLAIDALGANLGLTLGLGLLVAVPTVVVAGPLLAIPLTRWVRLAPPDTVLGVPEAPVAGDAPDGATPARTPSFGVSVLVVLLPVVLMLARSVTEIAGAEDTGYGTVLTFLGEPLVALLLTSLVALVAFGTGTGRTRAQLGDLVGSSFAPIAGILLIVGAGGGFKQTLVDSGVGDVIASGIAEAGITPLLAGWLVAALIRVATGSATVATITAAGIMAPLAAGLDPTQAALLVLAVGAGSVFLSHVNDAGFWLVKEYFGMTVGQTFKTWTLMESVLSVVALVVVLALGAVL